MCICLLTGTSNWSADYFINTGGVGLVVNETDTDNVIVDKHQRTNGQTTVQQQLTAIFERDWNSKYTRPVIDIHKNGRNLKRPVNEL